MPEIVRSLATGEISLQKANITRDKPFRALRFEDFCAHGSATDPTLLCHRSSWGIHAAGEVSSSS
jgi:hypothetical protein